jgi:hypothetical protein
MIRILNVSGMFLMKKMSLLKKMMSFLMKKMGLLEGLITVEMDLLQIVAMEEMK